MFFTEYEERMKSLRKSIDELDYSNIGMKACSLKGVVGNFYDDTVTDLARKLQYMVYNKTSDGLEETYQELEKRMVGLCEELRHIRVELTK